MLSRYCCISKCFSVAWTLVPRRQKSAQAHLNDRAEMINVPPGGGVGGEGVFVGSEDDGGFPSRRVPSCPC